jgi:methionyl-tRNA synthetase
MALLIKSAHSQHTHPQGTDEEKAAAGLVLVAVLEAARIVALLMAPVTPALSGEGWAPLGGP